MAKIDSFLELLQQKKVTQAVMSGDKPFVLMIGGQKTEGSVIPLAQLQQLLAEIAPEHLRSQITAAEQQGALTVSFTHPSRFGSFDIAVDYFAGVLQATITPAKTAAAPNGVPAAATLNSRGISPNLEQQAAASSQITRAAPNQAASNGITSVASREDSVCPKCGEPVQPSASFCPSCGDSLHDPHKVNVTSVEQADGNGTRVEIIQYNSLTGCDDISVAQQLFHAQKLGVRLKQVKISLNGGAVTVEAGALHFMKGHITMESNVGGVEGFAKKLASNVLTKETMFKPRYTGRGEIYLEPTFGHFLITHLNNEEMIVDRGMFYASEESVEVGVAAQKNISSALFGGEGLFQTRLAGTGWCILSSPVPSNEIVRYHLQNERLSVDGNFALLRKGQINFTVEKSTKSFLGNLTSGEGVLQTFTGTGEVWIAPTQAVYAQMKYRGVQLAHAAKGSSGSNT